MSGIVLPEDWSEHLVRVRNTNTNGFCGLCLAPWDLAVSKLAAGRPKDFDFVRELLRHRIVRREILQAAVERTRALDDHQREALLQWTRQSGDP
jgi:hypothetical protein